MLVKYFTREWYLKVSNNGSFINDPVFKEEHEHWLEIKQYFPPNFPYTKSTVHDLKLEKVSYEDENIVFEFDSNGALSEIAKLTFLHAKIDDPEQILGQSFKIIDCLYEEYALSDLKEYKYYMGILAINPYKVEEGGGIIPINIGVYFDDMQVFLKPKQFYYDPEQKRIRNK